MKRFDGGDKYSRPAHILLVEDQQLDIELTMDAFEQARLGNTLSVVRDGEQALRYIRGEGEYGDRETHPAPDLILLDLKLPKVDGHEVLAEIKSTPVIKRIPVIVLTSSAAEGDRMTSYDQGANSYLIKPVSVDAFLNVVQQIGSYWLYLNVSPPD